jgi:hypothetical protein
VQCVQIFYQVLVLEVLLIAVTFVPSDGGSIFNPFAPISLFVGGFIVVGPCIASAIVFRLIFRWGNKGRRQRPKRERAAALQLDAKKRGVEKTPETLRQSVARRFARATKAGALRFWSAWVLAFALQFIMLLLCLIYGSKLGAESTQEFIEQWALTLAMQCLMVEPLEVSLRAVAPPRTRPAPRAPAAQRTLSSGTAADLPARLLPVDLREQVHCRGKRHLQGLYHVSVAALARQRRARARRVCAETQWGAVLWGVCGCLHAHAGAESRDKAARRESARDQSVY